MAHINLLPWREEQRHEQTRQFATITVLSLVLTGAVMFLVHVTFDNQINHQKARNKMLQDEIKPMIEATKETVGTVRGTTTFLSEHVVTPVVNVASFASGVRRAAKVITGFRSQGRGGSGS